MFFKASFTIHLQSPGQISKSFLLLSWGSMKTLSNSLPSFPANNVISHLLILQASSCKSYTSCTVHPCLTKICCLHTWVFLIQIQHFHTLNSLRRKQRGSLSGTQASEGHMESNYNKLHIYYMDKRNFSWNLPLAGKAVAKNLF